MNNGRALHLSATALVALLACIAGAGCAATAGAIPAGPALAAATPSPPASAVLGIDLSKWQRTVRFEEVRKAGMQYVFVKATQGASGADTDYAANIQGARCAGLVVGSYHFFVTGVSAREQFSHFTAVADVAPGDLPPVVDIEVLHNNDDAGLAAELTSFLEQLQQRYHAKPIIYSGRSFSNRYLKGFSAYPLWLAEYTSMQQPRLPLDWTTWTFWQHSEDGSVAGVSGKVDLNRFHGDLPAFRNMLIGSTAPANAAGKVLVPCRTKDALARRSKAAARLLPA